jgi:hypothetical protein
VRRAGADGGGVRIAVLASSSGSGPFTVSNNLIYGSNDDSEYDDYGFYSSNNKADVVFTRNTVTQTGANNIVFELHTGKTEISYNNLDAGCWGTDPIFIMTYNGVNVTKEQRVAYNTFDMGTGSGLDYSHRATGVSFAIYPVPGPNATFSNMIITGNMFNNLMSHRRGIGFWNALTGPNLVGATITYNTINGNLKPTGSYGIDFYGLTVNATIANNKITGVETGICLRNGDAPGTKINYNCIAGNTIGVNWTLGSSTVDARFNWWGDSSGPHHPISNPSGLGDEVTNKVSFEPWLIAYFDYNRKNPVVGEPVTFDATYMTMPCKLTRTIVSYFWNFGDGTLLIATQRVVVHTFNAQGNYNVTLTLRYDDSTTYMAWSVVHVSKLPYLMVLPEEVAVKHRGDIFAVNITISDLDVAQKMTGMEFRITFNATLLEVVNATTGAFMSDTRWNKHGVFLTYNVFEAHNQLVVGLLLFPNGSGQWEAFPYGDGTVATIYFRMIYQERDHTRPPLTDDLRLFNSRLVDVGGNLLPHSTTFKVKIEINDLMVAEKFVGTEFRLAFDTSLLDIIGASPGDFILNPEWNLNGVLVIYHVEKNFNQAVVLVFLLPNATGKWPAFPHGSGTLVTLTFSVTYQTGTYHPPYSSDFPPYAIQNRNSTGGFIVHALYDVFQECLYKGYPTHLADVNFDGYVGIDDLFTMASAFGSEPGHPRWNPELDLNNDEYVGIDDIFYVANNFGWEGDC